MRLSSFCSSVALAVLATAGCAAQTPQVLTFEEPAKLVVKRTEAPTLALKASIQTGYHANSNTPSEEYLIPLKLTWEKGPLEVVEVVYPKPKFENYAFSDKPLSVVDGQFEIVTKFKRVANPALGPGFLAGKLRYQACNNKMCLPPKTLDVKLPLLIQ